MMQFTRKILHAIPTQLREFFSRRLALLSLFLLVDALTQAHGTPHISRDLNPAKIAATGPIHMQARNVSMQITDDVKLEARSVDALVLPTRQDRLVSLDDPTSMRLQILNAHTSISAEALTHLMNEYVLPQAKTSIRDLNVTFEEGHVHVTGKLRKVILDVPFAAEGPITVTANGNMRLHFETITAAGFVHKKMMDWLGMSLASVAGANKRHSFQIVDDDVIFPLHALFPAPHFTGRLQSVTIEGDQLIQIFGKPAEFAPAPVASERYIYFRGGMMEFGRITMRGVDLELLNKDQDRPMNFSIGHVFEQTVPGYIKNLPTRGMVAYIASYEPDGGTAKQ